MAVVDAATLSNLEIFGRLAAATGLGAVIGFEREIDGHDAGVRTHALLALGAALFGTLSVGAFHEFIAVRADSNVQVDVTRIASYVAAGVGFLCGGAIIKHKDRVRGLTTAASLWTCSAVGLAAGLGFIKGAVAATFAALVMLLLDAPLKRIRRRKERVSITVTLTAAAGIDDMFTSAVETDGVQISINRTEGGQAVVLIKGLLPGHAHELLRQASQRPDVVETSMS